MSWAGERATFYRVAGCDSAVRIESHEFIRRSGCWYFWDADRGEPTYGWRGGVRGERPDGGWYPSVHEAIARNREHALARLVRAREDAAEEEARIAALDRLV